MTSLMWEQFATATAMGARQHLRNTLFVALLVVLPLAFITTSFARTPDVPYALLLQHGGEGALTPVGMRNLHGALMVPMTVSFLAGILGMFVMLVSREGDRRLVHAGFPAVNLLLARLVVIAFLSLAITAIAVMATLPGFVPEQVLLFFLVNLVSALQWAFLGAVVGMFLSAMSGTYLMFFAPMIDVGLLQNPMFPRGDVAWWVQALPGFRPMEVLVDASFTSTFDTGADLLIAVAYLAALLLLGLLAFWRAIVGRS
jgi:hypothetical protein